MSDLARGVMKLIVLSQVLYYYTLLTKLKLFKLHIPFIKVELQNSARL